MFIRFYLSHYIIQQGGACDLPKDEVSIVSCVVTAHSEIYIASCDRTMVNVLKKQYEVNKICRCVVDYLVIQCCW